MPLSYIYFYIYYKRLVISFYLNSGLITILVINIIYLSLLLFEILAFLIILKYNNIFNIIFKYFR